MRVKNVKLYMLGNQYKIYSGQFRVPRTTSVQFVVFTITFVLIIVPEHRHHAAYTTVPIEKENTTPLPCLFAQVRHIISHHFPRKH